MSREQFFELESTPFDEAKALATCLEYLERCASEAGLYHCAKLINMAAEAASDAIDELNDPRAASMRGQDAAPNSLILEIRNRKKSERAN